MVDYKSACYKKVGDTLITSTLIGRGRFSAVYYGYLGSEENKLAIKCIQRKFLEFYQDGKNLVNDVKLIMTLNHENIIKLITVSLTTNNIYLGMEYFRSECLSEFLRKKEMNYELILSITRDIFEGIRFLKSRGITTHNIKPDNILVDKYGRVKLSNFGYSWDYERWKLDHSYIHNPMYDSLEEIEGIYSEKVDVFRLGVILFEAAFGHHPFFKKTLTITAYELGKMLINNPRIVFPDKPVLTENYKNMIRGMLHNNKEDGRLSWPQVFDLFMLEDTKKIDEQRKLLKLHIENHQSAVFHKYVANCIKEALSLFPEALVNQLKIIRTMVLKLLCIALRKVKKQFLESSVAEDFPVYLSQVEKDIKSADSCFFEETKNSNQSENFIYTERDLEVAKGKVIEQLRLAVADFLGVMKEMSFDEQKVKRVILGLNLLGEDSGIPNHSSFIIEKNIANSLDKIKNKLSLKLYRV